MLKVLHDNLYNFHHLLYIRNHLFPRNPLSFCDDCAPCKGKAVAVASLVQTSTEICYCEALLGCCYVFVWFCLVQRKPTRKKSTVSREKNHHLFKGRNWAFWSLKLLLNEAKEHAKRAVEMAAEMTNCRIYVQRCSK